MAAVLVRETGAAEQGWRVPPKKRLFPSLNEQFLSATLPAAIASARPAQVQHTRDASIMYVAAEFI